MPHIQPREQFSRLIGETYRLWRMRINDRLRPLGLSQARWTTLRALSRGGDAMPQTALAARVGIEAPTLVGILDGLASSGFVRRRASTRDRRIKTVHLTAKALRKLEQIEEVAQVLRREVTRNIDETTLATAIDALELIKTQLVAMAEKPLAAVASPGVTRPRRRSLSVARKAHANEPALLQPRTKRAEMIRPRS
jgi:MarR family transcriptional regulator, transcriptional regulator for hemolysin